jgi:Ca2+-binding EF-hand superfamily protein
MSMSISPVGNGNGDGFDPSKMASVMASKMMKDLDPNNTGKVTKDQFVSGMTAKGVSGADATKMYDAIDTNKTGSIGKSDIETAIKNGNLKPPSSGPQGGARGPGGPGKHGGGPGGNSGGANSSPTTYAAADTNQDGVVSVQEAAVYAVKHPSVTTTDSTKTDLSKLGKNVDQLV